MAEIGHKAHEDLLTDGLHLNKKEREELLKKILDGINEEDKLDEPEKEALGEPISNELIELALKESAYGSASGINGILYEYWKFLNKTKQENIGNQQYKNLNIIKSLAMVYNDIEEFGVDPSSKFTIGWMCLLYKKGDKRLIENYRPITLLNTDYKIYTKALAIKLAKAAPEIVHKNQAGSMPGRSITDQICLAKLMVHYSETTEQNGLIVALNQEKAYNKICHDYLTHILKNYNLPDQFINMVKSLYENAKTVVVINGVISAPFRVARGVRQGDPLSCLLFNLAIELLGNMLRKSNTLQGFQIPGKEEHLKVTLFTDDTTVYLKQNNEMEKLFEILDEWCIVSGAKFNTKKTVILPIGTPTYRLGGRGPVPGTHESFRL